MRNYEDMGFATERFIPDGAIQMEGSRVTNYGKIRAD